MLEFNQKKPLINGPIEFETSVEIERDAGTVFPLIDLASPGFAYLQRGATVQAVDGSAQRYRLTMEGLDDVVFLYHVTDRVEGRLHTAECVIEPRINDLVKAVESYEIEPIDSGSCKVTLITTATFDESLSDADIAGEIAMMSTAVHDDLLKLKVHAEEGADAVAALDDEGFDDFDFADINFGAIKTETEH